jgi:hypothetical protein
MLSLIAHVPRVQREAIVIVEFGHGAHSGAGGADGIGLVDCNRGRDTLDAINCRLVNSVKELPCVGGECFHVPALPFRIHGVESE